MRYISIIFTLLSLNTFAIDKATFLLRACIDNDDSTITVSWKKPQDNCGSFTKHHLYANENNTSFSKIATITDINTTEFSFKLLDINTNWKFYITTLNTCDGADSTTSAILDLDNIYPTYIQLDSVSYDLSTQNLIAGWTPNPDPDTHGYQVYDSIVGTNRFDSIGYTSNTSFTISTGLPTKSYNAIATKDSCNLYSIISKAHLATILNTSIDTCLNQISLNWNLYEGWASIDSQVLYVSLNHQPFIKDTTFTSLENNIFFNQFKLGDTITFYIRSFSKNITSSSNKKTIETRELVVPDYTYLNYVTVNDDKIEINWSSKKTQDVGVYEVTRSDNGTLFTKKSNQTNLPGTPSYTFTDADVNVDSKSYWYKIRTLNKCSVPVDSSNISQSILLEINSDLRHNAYIGWESGVEKYELEYQEPGFTWNTIHTENNIINLTPKPDSSGCYIIRATEIVNQYGYNSTSTSNKQCILDSLKIYVTTALNPHSQNNKFVIKGTGIDHNRSEYKIYTRWGENIVNNRTDEPWNATYKDQPVDPGVYLYIINVYGYLGEKRTEKGTFHVLK